MNEIVMIPVEQLHHHPENPRLDLGDLTELAESIRANGVMQNLTVVRGHRMSKSEWVAAAKAEGADKASAEASYDPERAEVSDGYTVVIGNRRMEAAKIAGLAEVPCVISDMDHRTQISTMLMENMQRTDLTVYEQAQGFQMMMDLGFTPEEISGKTGFSETTVRRRLKMAELDKDTFEKACGKQITMDDLDKLGKIKSVKQRNALLKKYGDSNYNWEVNRALQTQKAHEMKPLAMKQIRDAKLEKMPEEQRYSQKYRQLYQKTVRLYDWDGKSDIVPKSEQKLLYAADETTIEFWELEKKKKSEAKEEKTAEEKEEEKKRALAWKTVDRSAETAAELRKQYANNIGVSPKNAMRMMQWALVAAFVSMTSYNTPTLTIKNRFEVKSSVIPEEQAEIAKKLMDMPQSRWPELILLMFEGDYEGQKTKPPMFADGSRGYQFPKWKKNIPLELCYEWLTEFGYSMCTEEIEMMTGTHPVFQGAIV